MTKTLIVANSLEAMLLNWKLLDHEDQDTNVVWPKSHIGQMPLIGHRVVRDTPFMREALDYFECDYDEEFFFFSGVIDSDVSLQPLDDEPYPCLAFDSNLLMKRLVEFASPLRLDEMQVTDTNWDSELQEADICISHKQGRSGQVYEVLEFDQCVIDSGISGPSVPNKSFENNFQVLRIENAEFKFSDYLRAQSFDVIHVDPALGSIIDKFHTHGDLTTVFVPYGYSIERIQDALKKFVYDPQFYDWNTAPVTIPHMMSLCGHKSPHFVPWTLSELSEVELIAKELVEYEG